MKKKTERVKIPRERFFIPTIGLVRPFLNLECGDDLETIRGFTWHSPGSRCRVRWEGGGWVRGFAR